MISNCSFLTVFHKIAEGHNIRWIPQVYRNTWWFANKGANLQQGFENNNSVQIRIPYKTNPNMKISNFAIGDMIVNAKITKSITSKQDLINYDVFNVTSINNNNIGGEPHIHLGGK